MSTPAQRDENLTRQLAPHEWPEESPTLTDRDALVIARLTLEGKPKSHVEAARRLAQYVIDLNIQMGDIEDMTEILARETFHDTLPVMQAASVGIPTDE
jgi:hypothetical protein